MSSKWFENNLYAEQRIDPIPFPRPGYVDNGDGQAFACVVHALDPESTNNRWKAKGSVLVETRWGEFGWEAAFCVTFTDRKAID